MTKDDVFDDLLNNYIENRYKHLLLLGFSEEGAVKAAETSGEIIKQKYREANNETRPLWIEN